MKCLAHFTRLLLVISPLAAAAEADIHFGGFGTLGIAHSDNGLADYRADKPFAAKGPGRTAAWDTGLDSKLGLQLDGVLTQQLSAVLQVVSERGSDNNWTPEVEWANVKYQLAPQWRISLGRVMAPVLMASEWRKVGYAQTMVRPPAEVYTLNPVTNLDGVDLNYRGNLGNIGLQAKFEYGATHLRMDQPARKQDYKVQSIVLGRLSAEYGGSTFSIAGMHMVVDGSADFYTTQSKLLQQLISAGVSGAQAIQDAFIYRDATAHNYNLGYQYDRDAWMFRSEFFRNRSEGNLYPDLSGWYASGGYRLRQFTPYLAYAKVWSNEQYDWSPLDSSNLTQPLSSMAQTVNLINQQIASGLYAQHTWTIGLRWDPIEKLALKLQLENISKAAGRRSTFTNTDNQFIAEQQRIKLFSATLDFVF